MSRQPKSSAWPGDDEKTTLPCGDNRYLFVGGPDRQHLEIHCAKCPSRWGYLSPKLDEVRWLMLVYPPKRHYESYGFLRAGAAPRIARGQIEAFDQKGESGKPPAKDRRKSEKKIRPSGRSPR